MFSSQMGHLKPITYLPRTSRLQFYNLPTYLPTYQNVLPSYQPTHLPRCSTYRCTHPLAYLLTHPPTYLPTYLPTHPPISYNLPTFIPRSLVVMCQNNM
jgi:hypothetical protein